MRPHVAESGREGVKNTVSLAPVPEFPIQSIWAGAQEPTLPAESLEVLLQMHSIHPEVSGTVAAARDVMAAASEL